MRTIRPTELENELEANGLAGVPSMIHGGPGEGKSQLVYNFANKRGAKLYELRANLFDPVDVRGGLKVVEMEDGTYKTRYGIPEDYPPSDYEGTVVLFIDEITNAPKATQNALLQLLLDDKIGTYHLPKNTIKVAAGHRAKNRAAAHPHSCGARLHSRSGREALSVAPAPKRLVGRRDPRHGGCRGDPEDRSGDIRPTAPKAGAGRRGCRFDPR